MRHALRLFLIVAKATMMLTGGYFGLLLTAVWIGFRPEPISTQKAILGAVIGLLPASVAVWWVFRRLRKVYVRRESRAVSIAFAVFAPVSLFIALALSPVFGYAQVSGAPQLVGVLAIFTGVAILTALPSWLVCVFVLRMTRLAVSIEQRDGM